MRHVRSALTSFLLAVLVAVAVAGCGRIAFGAPSAEAGWLVFSGDSGGDDGPSTPPRCGSASPAIDMSECSLISSPRYE